MLTGVHFYSHLVAERWSRRKNAAALYECPSEGNLGRRRLKISIKVHGNRPQGANSMVAADGALQRGWLLVRTSAFLQLGPARWSRATVRSRTARDSRRH